MKSVNITNKHREKIKNAVAQNMMLTFKAKVPNKTFSKDFTTHVFDLAYQELDGHVKESPLKALLTYRTMDDNTYTYNRVFEFPAELRFYSLHDNEYSAINGHIYTKQASFATLKNEDFDIPEDLRSPTDAHKFLQLNGSFIQHIMAKHKDELKAKVDEYNEKFIETMEPLKAQIKFVMDTISECRSTKKFEEKLPQLTSFYPADLQKKLREANENDESASEEDKLLQSALGSIATGKLLASKE